MIPALVNSLLLSRGKSTSIVPGANNFVQPFQPITRRHKLDRSGALVGVERTFPVAPVGDPFFSSVKLLMGFEGVNGATGAPGFTDESPAAHGTATVTFDAAITTATFKAGTSSLWLNRGGANNKALATFPTSGDWNLGSTPFTIECFYRTNALDGGAVFQPIFKGPSSLWYLAFVGVHIAFFATDGASPFTLTDSFNQAGIGIDNWYYYCVDFDGTKYRLYNSLADNVGSPSLTTAIMRASSTSLITISTAATVAGFGTSSATLGEHVPDGMCDEFRFTKGVARYATDTSFPVPTVPFPRS